MNSSGLSVKVCLPKEERQELESYVVIEYLMGLVKLEAQRQFSVNTALPHQNLPLSIPFYLSL